MSGKKKRYYDNNWQEYKDADDNMFIPHTFEEVMAWKVQGWELPSSVCCLIRATDLETSKVTEFVYRKHSAAQRKVQQLINTPNTEFVVCDHDAVHFLTPANIDDYEYDDD